MPLLLKRMCKRSLLLGFGIKPYQKASNIKLTLILAIASWKMKSMKGYKKSHRVSRSTIVLAIGLVFFGCSDLITEKLRLISPNLSLAHNEAVVFGEGKISTDAFEFAITFTPEMDEVFWTRRQPDLNNEIMTMQLVDGHWTDPEPVFFKANSGWDFEPHINPQGTRLYFGSTRPIPDSSKSTGLHQWYSMRTQNGWSNPVPLESPVIDKSVIMYLTSSEKGNLFFTAGEKGDNPEDWVIYQSINQEGKYQPIERMGSAINFEGKYIAHSYVAPDESYLIYDAKRDSGYGGSDLYISFNRRGQWTEAINMGPQVNTPLTEMCPSISPDQKYLFFHRGDENKGNIYWIEFQPIKAQLELQSKNNSKK